MKSLLCPYKNSDWIFLRPQPNFRKSYLPHTTSEFCKLDVIGKIFWLCFHTYKEIIQYPPEIEFMAGWKWPKHTFRIWKFSTFPYLFSNLIVLVFLSFTFIDSRIRDVTFTSTIHYCFSERKKTWRKKEVGDGWEGGERVK